MTPRDKPMTKNIKRMKWASCKWDFTNFETGSNKFGSVPIFDITGDKTEMEGERMGNYEAIAS